MLELRVKYHPGDYKGKMLGPEHYDTLITEDGKVINEQGEVIAVFKKRALSLDLVKNAWAELRDWHPKTENRGTASGVTMQPRLKLDGTVSKTLRAPKGLEVESGVAGFMDRYVRIPYCRPCAINSDNPRMYSVLAETAKAASACHAEMHPESFAYQKSWIDKTNEHFRIKDAIYTTMTINKNFRTAAHLDANNLHDGMASMTLIREGKYEGGYVVFPEWRFAVAMDTGDLVVFRNMKDYHGNTKIVGLTENYQRCTIVYYYRDGMIHCGSPEEEFQRAKNRKLGDPMK